jgi:hypothetical protein
MGLVSRAAIWIQEHSAVYLLLKESLHTDLLYLKLLSKISRRLRPRFVNYEPFKLEIDQVARRFRENVKAIIKLAKGNGSAVLLVKQPMTAQNREANSAFSYEEEYQSVLKAFDAGRSLTPNQLILIKHHRLMEELDRIAEEEKLTIVDNIGIVDRHRGGLASWVHLTEEANLRLAEALAAALQPYLQKPQTTGAHARSR